MNTYLLLPFAAYFCVLLSIGLISHKKQNSSADFIVGNRSLNFWVTALSAHASDMSSWLFMAFPAAVFMGGLSQTWIAFGLLTGMFLNWQLVAKKLRTSTENYDSYTLSTFFEKRFNDTSGVLRLLTAIMALTFLTCYISAGLIAMGGILESLFGIDFYVGITIACVVILIYTFSGGFITVAWTDLFQALFLISMILIVPIVAYFKLENGFTTILESARAKGVTLSLFPDFSFKSILGIVFLILSWGLGYFGQPHIVTKFMGIRKASDMNKSKYVGMTWQLIALLAAAAIGLVGIPYFAEGLANPELVFIEMVKSMFHPLLAGFILCGVLAASMSTMDSQILVCGSVISEDLYKNIFKKPASQKELLIITRLGIVFVSALSLFFALNKNSTILEAVLYAWSGLGCAFGPLVLMSLYSKKANKFGAVAGVLTGGLVAGFWNTMNPYFTEMTIPSMIPGFFISLLSISVVSWLTETERSVSSVEVSS
ncbi:MAG: sodium/proline symporter [Parachlamydiaceae bacterium]|nr:sodium/proline symporter [Parachlamydiaceae bacterium]